MAVAALRRLAGQNTDERRLQNLRPPWKKGQSANPGGRPQSRHVVETIRRETRGGVKLVRFLLRVAEGKRVRSGAKRLRPTLDQRVVAARELLDRGWGRPVSAVEATALFASLSSDGHTLSAPVAMTDADRAAVMEYLALARRPPALPSPEEEVSDGQD